MLKTITIAAFVLLASAIILPAQTISEIETKYGKPMQVFEVRPGIMMRLKVDEKGIASEISLSRLTVSDSTIHGDAILSDAVIKEIVDELVPLSSRGERSKFSGLTLIIGASGTQTENFGNVSITYYTGYGGKCSGLVAVVIRWTSRVPASKDEKTTQQ